MIKLDYATPQTPRRIWVRRYLLGVLCLGTLHFLGSVCFLNLYFEVDFSSSTLWPKDAFTTPGPYRFENDLFRTYEFPMIVIPTDWGTVMMLHSRPYYIEFAICNAVLWSSCIVGLWHVMWVIWRRRGAT